MRSARSRTWAGGLLAADDQCRSRLGRGAGGPLLGDIEQQGRLADSGLASEQDDAARHQAAAEHPVQLGDAGRSGPGRLDADRGDRAGGLARAAGMRPSARRPGWRRPRRPSPTRRSQGSGRPTSAGRARTRRIHTPYGCLDPYWSACRSSSRREANAAVRRRPRQRAGGAGASALPRPGTTGVARGTVIPGGGTSGISTGTDAPLSKVNVTLDRRHPA